MSGIYLLKLAPKPYPDFNYFRLFPWDVFEWQVSVPSHRAWEYCVLRCWDVSASVTRSIWRRYGCFLQNSGWGANHSLGETGPPGLWCHVKPKGSRASVFILLGPDPSHGTNFNYGKIAFLRVLSFLGEDLQRRQLEQESASFGNQRRAGSVSCCSAELLPYLQCTRLWCFCTESSHKHTELWETAQGELTKRLPENRLSAYFIGNLSLIFKSSKAWQRPELRD